MSDMLSKPTIHDVASAAGVEVSTASGILNNRRDAWAAEGTRARVMAAAETLGYRPNQAMSRLRRRSHLSVGGVFSDLTNPFYAMLVRMLQEALEREGYNMVVEETRFDAAREVASVEGMAARQIDGLVCTGLDYRVAGARLHEMNRRMPVVVIGNARVLEGLDTVATDFQGSMMEAVGHLKGLNHERISYVSAYPRGSAADQRAHFFLEAMRGHLLPVGPESVLDCGFYEMGRVRDGVRTWMEGFPVRRRPTALVCLNDLAAIGAARGVMDMGLHVPEHVSLVGIDNIELAEYLPIPLTTIAQPVAQMAAYCAERLVTRIERRRTVEPAHHVLPARLVVRQSTALARS